MNVLVAFGLTTSYVIIYQCFITCCTCLSLAWRGGTRGRNRKDRLEGEAERIDKREGHGGRTGGKVREGEQEGGAGY